MTAPDSVNIHPRPEVEGTAKIIVYFIGSMDFNILEQKDVVPFLERLAVNSDSAKLSKLK